ncbi:MAG TPA: 2-C-methyl-D-erythritol 4-phosphate cytidylyltransferase [Micromonosporaceae bacterium]|nr:2-C-methyl-D-erythritol 4-phosphate cytidylyltransferase [Micromonosporaceae bacterium]
MTAQPSPRGDVAVLVPAAGSGVRLGAGAPKALRSVAGRSLLEHAVDRVLAASSVGFLVIAAPPSDVDSVRSLLPPEVVVVPGGATRQESVARALAEVPERYEIVLVHDAARALAPPSLVDSVAAAVRSGHDAVIPVLPVVDTVKAVDDADLVVGTVDRSALRAVQTPQGFRRAVLAKAHAAAPAGDVSDDAGLVERLGVRVFCVPGSELALKITRPFDLLVAEVLLGSATLRAWGTSAES